MGEQQVVGEEQGSPRVQGVWHLLERDMLVVLGVAAEQQQMAEVAVAVAVALVAPMLQEIMGQLDRQLPGTAAV